MVPPTRPEHGSCCRHVDSFDDDDVEVNDDDVSRGSIASRDHLPVSFYLGDSDGAVSRQLEPSLHSENTMIVSNSGDQEKDQLAVVQRLENSEEEDEAWIEVMRRRLETDNSLVITTLKRLSKSMENLSSNGYF